MSLQWIKTLSDDPHNILIEVTDNDGNKQSRKINFKVDTMTLTLNTLSSNDNVYTNEQDLSYFYEIKQGNI